MSLSSWFRDYVYIPLGGSRTGDIRSFCALAIAMVLSGLWHGAAWHFVVWGGLHAILVGIERLTEWPRRIPRAAAIGITFMLFCLTLVFFRAGSLPQAVRIVSVMVNPLGWVWVTPPGWTLALAALVSLTLLGEIWAATTTQLRAVVWIRPWQPILAAMLLWAAVLFRGPGTTFIYFQF